MGHFRFNSFIPTALTDQEKHGNTIMYVSSGLQGALNRKRMFLWPSRLREVSISTAERGFPKAEVKAQDSLWSRLTVKLPESRHLSLELLHESCR